MLPLLDGHKDNNVTMTTTATMTRTATTGRTANIRTVTDNINNFDNNNDNNNRSISCFLYCFQSGQTVVAAMPENPGGTFTFSYIIFPADYNSTH